MSNKTLGKTAYYTKTGTNYILEEPVKAQQDILVYTRKSVETNYSTFVPYNDYTISYSENGSTLIFTNPISLTDVESIKVIYPFDEVIISSEADFSDNNVKKDLLTLKDRIIDLEELLEYRVLMQENSNGDTQYPKLLKETFHTLINDKPSLKNWKEFVTWEDAGLINDRTKVYDFIFNVHSGETIINTQLVALPKSNLCFLDRFLANPATTSSLSNGDYFIYLDADGKVKIKIKPLTKDTTFKLFYNIVSGDGNIEDEEEVNIIKGLDSFEDAIQLTNSYDTNLTTGKMFYLKGYYYAGDGAGHFRIVSDTSNLLSIPLFNGKFANILSTTTINPTHCGAKGDGINDDTNVFKNILTFAKTITLPSNKTFLIKDKLTLSMDTSIVCLDNSSSKMLFTTTLTNEYIINSIGYSLKINNVVIESTSKNENCITISNARTLYLENVLLNNFNIILNTINISYITIEGSELKNSNTKFLNINNSKNVDISNNIFGTTATFIYPEKIVIENCSKINITGCSFERTSELFCLSVKNSKKLIINENYFFEVNIALKVTNVENTSFDDNYIKYINDSVNNDVTVISSLGVNNIYVTGNTIEGFVNNIVYIDNESSILSFMNNTSDFVNKLGTVNLISDKCFKFNNKNILENKVLYGLTSEASLTSLQTMEFRKGDLFYTNGFLIGETRTFVYQRITDGTTNTIGVDWILINSN